VSLETLEQDSPGAGESGHEEAFAGEEDTAQATGGLDVVIDGFGEGGEVAGADDGGLTGAQGIIDEVAGAVHQDRALAGDFLEEEAGAAEEGCTGAAGDRDVDVDLGAEGGHEGTAGGDDGAVCEVPGQDFAGLIGAEQDTFTIASGADIGQREAFAGEHAADGAAEAAGDFEGPLDVGVEGDEGSFTGPAIVAGVKG